LYEGPDGTVVDEDGNTVWTPVMGTPPPATAGPFPGEPIVPEEPVIPGEPVVPDEPILPDGGLDADGYIDARSMSVTLSSLLDREITEDEVLARATELGILGGPDELGLTPDGMATLLASFGMSSSVDRGSVDGLEDLLHDGCDISVRVDFGDDDGRPVRAEVTEIDRERSVVRVRESGGEREAEIRIQDLEREWEKDDNRLILARNTPRGDRWELEEPQSPALSETPRVDRWEKDDPLGSILGGAVGAAAILPVFIAKDLIQRVSPWGRSGGDDSPAAKGPDPTS
jgi:hypothetical protein